MIEPLLVVIAFLVGAGFSRLGMPPLLGFLLTGFFAGALSLGDRGTIQALADLGVTLLLFTIGLKLNLRQLMAPQIWAPAFLHALIVVPLTTAMILALPWLVGIAEVDLQVAATLAFALSFSSTVFAIKIFDQRGEGASLHARITIGILIVQDLMAVAYLVASAGHPPSIWALGLLGLPLLKPLLTLLMRQAGHGELLVLFGLAAALGSAALFEALHLKAGLGALLFGVLLAGDEKSAELYKSLISLKDLFLTAFFLSIGYYGLPSGQMIAVAVILSALIFLRPIIYFFLLTLLRLRARTALLSGLALFNYSEFGLIVAALAVQAGLLPATWLTTLAVAMALSLFIAVPFNTHIHELYSRFARRLQRFERAELVFEERPVSLGESEVVIFGMGRVGSGAYEYLQSHFPDRVIGVEEDTSKAAALTADGVACVHGDATDRDFLARVALHQRKLVLVSLTNHAENMEVVRLLHGLGFSGTIAVVARFPDEQRELNEQGCIAFNLYAEAGHGFAERVMEELRPVQS